MRGSPRRRWLPPPLLVAAAAAPGGRCRRSWWRLPQRGLIAVPVEAIPQALVASVYPLGLAMVLVLAAATRPRAKAIAFLVGAAVCTLAISFAVVFVLRGSGLALRSHHQTHYGVRLAFGVVLLIAAVVVARWPRKPKPEGGEPSRWIRWARDGGLIVVFLLGIALYLPSPVYLAALEHIGSARLATAVMVGWVILVTALVLITIEVPILLFLFAPDWTIPKLQAVNAWLGRHARLVIVIMLSVLGVWQAAEGLRGLLS